jgi:hypothetical protein
VTRRVRTCAAGVWGKVGKEREKNKIKQKLREKSVIKIVEIHDNVIFKNVTMIIILAIELLNTILLLVF